MSLKTVVLLYSIVFASLQGLNSVKITSWSPRHQRIQPNTGVANFYCHTDSAINQCQYNVWESNEDMPLIDSSNLSQRWQNVSIGIDTFSVRDYNSDLARGLCGMSLKVVEWGLFVVGCRVRATHGGWEYRYSTLFASFHADLASDLIIEPEDDVLVSPGNDVNITCKSTTDGRGCRFSTANGLTKWAQNASTCGATYHVSELNSRMIWCWNRINGRASCVISAKPPTSLPRLVLSELKNGVGDVLMQATCTVTESRPPANITWYLDNEVIHHGVKEVALERWRWRWQAESREQALKINLSADDLNKTLTCETSHVAMQRSLRSSIALTAYGMTLPIGDVTTENTETQTKDLETPNDDDEVAKVNDTTLTGDHTEPTRDVTSVIILIVVVSGFIIIILAFFSASIGNVLHRNERFCFSVFCEYEKMEMSKFYVPTPIVEPAIVEPVVEEPEKPVRPPCPLPRPSRFQSTAGAVTAPDMRHDDYLEVLPPESVEEPIYQELYDPYEPVEDDFCQQDSTAFEQFDGGHRYIYNRAYDHIRRQANRPLPDAPAKPLESEK